jgi:hypothetical protein
MENRHYVHVHPVEKARITTKCEARLGVQHFFSPTKVVVPSVQVLQTLEQRIENEEKKFHKMYTHLFAKAISSLKSSQDLRKL